MKIACIYHSIDLDGWMSAAIVKHWFIKNNEHWTITDCNKTEFNTSTNHGFIGVENPELDFIGYNYGQPIPDLSEYDKVIMCDISFPATTMSALNIDKTKELIWIDHHVSAINDSINPPDDLLRFDRDGSKVTMSYNNVSGLRDTTFAACELTWQYFFPEEKMPEIVRLLGRYDCFGHKGTDEERKIIEFQYGARECITNYEEAYSKLQQNLSSPSIIKAILQSGNSIYGYLCTEAKQTYQNSFDIMLYWAEDKGTTVPRQCSGKFKCVNKDRFNAINFGIDYHADGYDGQATFQRTKDGKWTFSFYSQTVDCSAIAKQFGGGGHKGAAGCVVNDETMLKIINSK